LVDKILDGFEDISKICLPGRFSDIKLLWRIWKYIVIYLQQRDYTTLEYITNLKQFGELVLNTFEWKILTPYIHIIVDHSVYLMLRWGNLYKYSQQGLEDANKLHKKIAQRVKLYDINDLLNLIQNFH
jgi:hypothetical protein